MWLRQHPILQKLTIARASGSSIYHITAKDWNRIITHCGGWPSTTSAELAEYSIHSLYKLNEPASIFPYHRGRQTNLHQHALAKAIRHYQNLGYIVTEQTSYSAFDLSCKRIGEIEKLIMIRASTSLITEMLLSAQHLEQLRNNQYTSSVFIMDQLVFDPFSDKVEGESFRIIDGRESITKQAQAIAYQIRL